MQNTKLCTSREQSGYTSVRYSSCPSPRVQVSIHRLALVCLIPSPLYLPFPPSIFSLSSSTRKVAICLGFVYSVSLSLSLHLETATVGQLQPETAYSFEFVADLDPGFLSTSKEIEVTTSKTTAASTSDRVSQSVMKMFEPRNLSVLFYL